MDSTSALALRAAAVALSVTIAGVVSAVAMTTGDAGGERSVVGPQGAAGDRGAGDGATDGGRRSSANAPAATSPEEDAQAAAAAAAMTARDQAAAAAMRDAAGRERAAGGRSPSVRTPKDSARRPARAAAPPSRPVQPPPPRPNRASDAPDQPSAAAAPPPDPTSPAPPASTARYGQDFPDPFLLRSGAYWYAFSTQRGLGKVPVIRSVDLVHWEERGDALAALPRWSRFGAVWAPSVLPVPGGFVLYYATPHDATGLQCLSVAVSALPDGPFVDASPGPFVCQTDRGGSIDPSPFRDAQGRPWLAWKSEGTISGEPTRLWSQPLSDDGRRLLDTPHELLQTAQPWEGPIIEAPSMVETGGTYHLFYSGNRWETSAYAIGHAVCDGPAGPCRRSAPDPAFAAHPTEAGPGGGEVFRLTDGSLRIAYHAWDPQAVGYPGGLRRLRIGALSFDATGRATIEPLPV